MDQLYYKISSEWIQIGFYETYLGTHEPTQNDDHHY